MPSVKATNASLPQPNNSLGHLSNPNAFADRVPGSQMQKVKLPGMNVPKPMGVP